MITTPYLGHSAIGPELSTLSTGAIYLVLFGFVLLESGLPIGLVLPGDSLLFGAGLLAAVPNSGLSLAVLVTLSAIGGILGEAIGYEVGRRAGRPWLLRHQGRHMNVERLDRAERFTASYGWFALVVARFLPWLRSFAAPLAGVTRMRYATFTSANVIGAVVWSTSITVLGYYAYQVHWLRWAAFAITVAAIAAAIAVSLVQFVRHRMAKRRGDGDERDAAANAADASDDPNQRKPSE
jgi:membrane-associated protein